MADGRREAAGRPPDGRYLSGGVAWQAGGEEVFRRQVRTPPQSCLLCLGNHRNVCKTKLARPYEDIVCMFDFDDLHGQEESRDNNVTNKLNCTSYGVGRAAPMRRWPMQSSCLVWFFGCFPFWFVGIVGISLLRKRRCKRWKRISCSNSPRISSWKSAGRLVGNQLRLESAARMGQEGQEGKCMSPRSRASGRTNGQNNAINLDTLRRAYSLPLLCG